MSRSHSFLLELGLEELPAQAMKSLSHALDQFFRRHFHEAQLNFDSLDVFATPRRLAILVKNLDAQQKDETVMVRGPSVAAAFNEQGQAKGPAIGFATSCGVSVDDLTRISSKKGEYLAYEKFEKGKTIEELLPPLILAAGKELAAAKGMRWGAGLHRFLRPLRWLTALLDTEILHCECFGLQANRVTYGHRIHAPEPISLTHAEEYEPRLMTLGYVIPSFATRRQTILDEIKSVAASQKFTAQPSAALIDEITGLVEWPVTLTGTFDEAFLKVPHECLISTMEKNQKYIAVRNAQGHLTNQFLFVANLESTAPELVIQGNERVIRPRFADAQFFYETDKSKLLTELRSGLQRVIYQKELGSVFDKTERLAQLTVRLSQMLKLDLNDASLAGQLSKVDLLTAMVGEFPELQGTMGRYYALAQGLSPELAQALEEQYLPRGQGDALPNSSLGIVLSVADKLDSLVGMFAIGQEPSADKDPFALRRMALGIVRMCIELELDLDLLQMARIAGQFYTEQKITEETAEKVAIFIMQRLPTLYKDSGIDMRLVRAVESLRIYNPSDFNKRLVVLQKFYQSEGAAALAEVHKRVNNILKKNAEGASTTIQTEYLSEPAERALHDAFTNMQADVEQAQSAGDYERLLQLGASLRSIVDEFFIHVKVMSENPVEQQNRLALLEKLRQLFAQVGDLSYLA